MNSEFDVIVVGAGVHGLAAAYNLSFHRQLKVAILEQHLIGHPFGGSHGASRIFRSTYSHPAYIDLMKRLCVQDWPELERQMQTQFLYPNPGCFFGRGRTFEGYLQTLSQSDLNTDVLTPQEAKRLFPQFRFQDAAAVVHDRTAGVIDAKKTIRKLLRRSTERGISLFENTKLISIDGNFSNLRLITNTRDLFAKKLIITAGAWASQWLPITPIQQTIAYFKLEGPPNSIGKFPCWSYIGEGENAIFYGLPEFGCEGIKIARHVTTGSADDPDQHLYPDQAQVKILEKFVQAQFVPKIERLVSTETCFYANLPDEGFIVDLFPHDKRIAIGSVCSGHGFKFAPLIGKLLAELVLTGATTVSEFEKWRDFFSMKEKVINYT
ncbi:MAG: FAD-dependent oxidoreductase [Parachlamydiales bacterium]|nr:FAD-dependent oxidoreductase [Verrucomicrobiota bacterium]MBX3718712.1 FAD-dependent oxidoreductase [Candidatus Acheromyda pituitae]